MLLSHSSHVFLSGVLSGLAEWNTRNPEPMIIADPQIVSKQVMAPNQSTIAIYLLIPLTLNSGGAITHDLTTTELHTRVVWAMAPFYQRHEEVGAPIYRDLLESGRNTTVWEIKFRHQICILFCIILSYIDAVICGNTDFYLAPLLISETWHILVWNTLKCM